MLPAHIRPRRGRDKSEGSLALAEIDGGEFRNESLVSHNAAKKRRIEQKRRCLLAATFGKEFVLMDEDARFAAA